MCVCVCVCVWVIHESSHVLPVLPNKAGPYMLCVRFLHVVVVVCVVVELRYRWENGHLIPKLVANRSVPLCPPV